MFCYPRASTQGCPKKRAMKGRAASLWLGVAEKGPVLFRATRGVTIMIAGNNFGWWWFVAWRKRYTIWAVGKFEILKQKIEGESGSVKWPLTGTGRVGKGENLFTSRRKMWNAGTWQIFVMRWCREKTNIRWVIFCGGVGGFYCACVRGLFSVRIFVQFWTWVLGS